MVYKYRLKNCNNYDKYYYILGTTGYLLLNNRYLIAQNNAINDGTASVETPPMSLIRQMVVEQIKAKRLLFYSGQQMIATLIILSDRMLGINQFFDVGFKGLNREFRIISKAEVIS